MDRLCALAGVGLVAVAAAATASDPPPSRPLLVTVDDLPVASGRLHTDSAERERITDGLLAVLARHHVPAIGFVIWGNVAGDADVALLERWLAAGHELGNHTRSHLDLSRTAADEYVADAEAGRAGLAALLGRHGRALRFFRFPYLREGNTEAKLDAMRAYLARSGQTAVPVTIDDQDWSYEERWVTARRAGDAVAMARVAEEYQAALRVEVVSQTETGDDLFERPVPQILLLHANEVGAAQWDALFSWLESRGYRFARADEVLADAAIATPPAYVNDPGGSLWYRVGHERQVAQAREQVTRLLEVQADAWNRGDLPAFCAVYDAAAVFLTPSGLVRGRQAVLDRYAARYPSRAAMGTLTLAPVEVREAWGNEATLLGDAVPSRVHAVSVVARWTLTSADGSERTGLTLLVFLRRDGRWVIVQDASM
ncbi:MAG TPA: polysaccharide deacetylase family protein [Thermoanaerobaculaceae bacterium]|nr:polysaccharide deacetylase family protein [Thermoanaerobaculaceae bacterium]